jgi:hypothetical protein
MVKYLALLSAAVMTASTQTSLAQTPPATQPSTVSRNWLDAPRISPFTAVRWNKDLPKVQIDGTWYALLSLNGLSAAQLVDLCKSVEEKQWQKRFEEDLVAVLTRTGHTPADTATVTVRELDTGKSRTMEKVPMTQDNRQAIIEARSAAEDKARTGARP